MGKYIFLLCMILFSWQGHAASEELKGTEAGARGRASTAVLPTGIGLPLSDEEGSARRAAPSSAIGARPTFRALAEDLRVKRLLYKVGQEYYDSSLSALVQLTSNIMLFLEIVPIAVMANNHPWVASRIGGLILADPFLRAVGPEYARVYRHRMPNLGWANLLLPLTGTGLVMWSIGDWLTGKERSLGKWGMGMVAIGLLDTILTHYKGWSSSIREQAYQNWTKSMELLNALVCLAIIDCACF